MLITSRNPLTILEGANPLSPDLLDLGTARELLGKLVGPDRVAAEPQAADAIARYCGYLPLALRIAGAKLAARPTWPLLKLADWLMDERNRLAELRVGDLEVRASFALSYTSLDPVQARTFRLLGLLDGPDWTPAVAAALADCPVDAAEQALEGLADAQLLETPLVGRYRFHDLLRLFAQERLEAEEPEQERRAALRRMLSWYLVTARLAIKVLRPARLREADGQPSDGRLFTTYEGALSWLEAERPNLVAVVRQASEQRWDALTWQLAAAPWDFFNLRKYWPDWQETGELGLQAALRAGDRAAEGRMLHNLGYVLRDRRQFAESTARLHESLAIFREIGDRFWEGRTLGTLGTAHRKQQHREQAITCYEQSLVIRREVGDRLGEAQALEALGSTYRQEQRLDEATACLRQSLAAFHEIGDRWGEGRALGHLGRVCLEQQRLPEAAVFLEQCLAITREVADRYNEGITLADLARLHAGDRRFEEAETYLQQSLAIFQELGDRYAIGQILKNLGLLVEHVRGHQAARTYWEAALDALTPLHDPDATRIERWIEQPGQEKPLWSEWAL